MVVAAQAARTLESNYRMGGQDMHAAFEEIQPALQTGSAVFRKGTKEVIFGVVVSPDGQILTKASELGAVEDLNVIIGEQTYEQPVLLAVDPQWDVALVKVSAVGLIPVDLSRMDELERGEWVVANGATTRRYRRVQVGMVSANSREVRASGGAVLGVVLKEDEGLEVSAVSENSGAAEAGLKEGDRIISIEGTRVESREEVFEVLKERRVGQSVKLQIGREKEELTLDIELAGRTDVFGEEMSRNDHMSGDFSTRRTGFPRVMQHDIIGSSRFMGGPVVDLDGRCVGMNIARFSRCETYAIPARDLVEVIETLQARAEAQSNG